MVTLPDVEAIVPSLPRAPRGSTAVSPPVDRPFIVLLAPGCPPSTGSTPSRVTRQPSLLASSTCPRASPTPGRPVAASDSLAGGNWSHGNWRRGRGWGPFLGRVSAANRWKIGHLLQDGYGRWQKKKKVMCTCPIRNVGAPHIVPGDNSYSA